MLAKCREYIVHQTGTLEEFRATAEYLNLVEDSLVVSVMEFISYETPQNEEEQKKEKKRNVILGLMQELVAKYCEGVVLNENDKRYLFVMNMQSIDTVETLLREIRAMLRKYVNGKAVFGISGFADSYASLAESYTEAVEAWREAVFWEEDMVLYGSKTEAKIYQDTQITRKVKILLTKTKI